MTGEVVHFEIPADNVKRASKFYEKTFGWQLQPIPKMNYTMVGTTESDANGRPKAPGVINGGMARRGAPLKSTVVTILADDIDTIAKVIQKNGGKIVQPKIAIGDMGFAAYFKDTEGNVVGLFQRAMG